jgi:hypothetical protein
MATEKGIAIFNLAKIIFDPDDGDVGVAAFTQLCAVDLAVAEHTAAIMRAALPKIDRLLKPILDAARQSQEEVKWSVKFSPEPFRWYQRDAANTADKIAVHMGWTRKIC